MLTGIPKKCINLIKIFARRSTGCIEVVYGSGKYCSQGGPYSVVDMSQICNFADDNNIYSCKDCIENILRSFKADINNALYGLRTTKW